MSHNIEISEGRARMAYAGDTPWHGLGVKLPGRVSTQEMLSAAGLAWIARRVPLVTTEGGEIDSHVAIVRDEDQKVLSVVSRTYEVLQNADAFYWGDDLLGAGAIWETAGCLDEGRRTWCLARIPETVEVVKNDPINVYLVIANSFDESLALSATITPVRVVCQNTLSMALNGTTRTYRLLHTSGIRQRMDLAAEVLGITRAYTGLFKEQLARLAAKSLTEAEMQKYALDLFPDPLRFEPDSAPAMLQSDRRRTLRNAMSCGRGSDIPGIWGTAYGLFQAAAEVIDHDRSMRLDRQPADSRRAAEQQAVAVTLGGRRQEVKQEAFRLALALC